MPEFSEAGLRLAVFIAIFASMAILERLIPRRPADAARPQRWLTNLAMLALDSIVLRILFPAAAVGIALYGEANGIGLMALAGVPEGAAALFGFLALDFTTWVAHVASHKWPPLWRVHKVHHSDIDLDVTSALRFHPIEIVLSMLWKGAVILMLGIPASGVLLFEIVLNGAAMFNHANIGIGPRTDRWLRYIIVTPDMHRIHHSVHPHETDSNYGFNLSLWDRLFRTYIDAPEDGQTGMKIGLDAYPAPQPTRLIWSLALPFARNVQRGTDSTSPAKGSSGKAR